MSNFKFNKIYVIESLNDNEHKTGEDLYNDILRWKQIENDTRFVCEYKPINSKIEYKTLIDQIEKECANGIFPILHFEIHGFSDKSGLSLNNSEPITYLELTADLSKINKITGNNLFLTLAVCHGAYLLHAIKINEPAPYLSFIGSFDSINNDDILYRYSEFYSAFLTDFNLISALNVFFNANFVDENKFSFVDTEHTFRSVYKKYLLENTSKEGIQKRIKDTIFDNNLSFSCRQEKRKFGRDFEKQVIQTKQKYYKEHKDIFFMIKDFPLNEKRFKIPEKYSGILN